MNTSFNNFNPLGEPVAKINNEQHKPQQQQQHQQNEFTNSPQSTGSNFNNLEETTKYSDDDDPIDIDDYDDNEDDDNDNGNDYRDKEENHREFFFESDHLALRGNSDYTTLLRSIISLETQKIQVIKDIERLAKAETSAMQNPQRFVERLTKGENLDLPAAINIVEIPQINFDKFGVPGLSETVNDLLKDRTVNEQSTNSDIIVRGRVFDETKTETFNQLWTCEEQRRLEELLIEYPPEPVEMRRFAKIARALGNRTLKQVCSRLQKYFKKLHSAGMPIPGRLPKSVRSGGLKNNPYRNLKVLRPTTFFPANIVSVKINDDDINDGDLLNSNYYRSPSSIRNPTATSSNDCIQSNDLPDNAHLNDLMYETIPIDDEEFDEDDDFNSDNANGTNSKVLTKLKLLKRIKKDKEIDVETPRPPSVHDYHTCDHCSDNPIYGTRWHCESCEEVSIDFCSDCLINQLLSGNSTTNAQQHPIDHKFIGYRVVSTSYLNREQSDMDSSDSEMITVTSISRTTTATTNTTTSTTNMTTPTTVYNKNFLITKQHRERQRYVRDFIEDS